MQFISTRGKNQPVSSARAIYQGLATDGGLFLPNSIPQLTLSDIEALGAMSYSERASYIIGKFLTDYTTEELNYATGSAYAQQNFPKQAAPVVNIDTQYSVLELWHGKTSAFKDMALQILPYLLTIAMKKEQIDKQVLILVATSGDTGKAALEGFQDVPGTRIVVFYPQDGVSDIQKLQMATQAGENVHVFAVRGNFDDTQTGVKNIFSNPEMSEQIAALGYQFSSANSINWGRLVPQIVYYFSAYVDLVQDKVINLGDQVNFCVPTGNFGNILAGYYAKCMGLPVNKFICASNANNVLTDFINQGVYDRNRPFYQTNSPSMDILISSNLERFLYLISGGNAELINGYMSELNAEGRYAISPELLSKVQAEMSAYSYDGTQTCREIMDVYKNKHYLLDTHTAVAYKAAEDYRTQTGDKTHTVILSTASPFKFSADVLLSLEQDIKGLNSFEQNRLLSNISGQGIPERIAQLETATVRHQDVINKEEMFQAIKSIL